MKKGFPACALPRRFSPSTSAQDPVVMTPSGPQPTRRAVTADQINGLYRYRGSYLRTLALGHHKLKAQFNGQWMTRGGYPNIGEAMGGATIEGNVATFIPVTRQSAKSRLPF